MIYLDRQAGCCEELIMVHPSEERPCFILIMGFHSLVPRLPLEPKMHLERDGFSHMHPQDQADSLITLLH